ncbi:unnamed protein product [Auanema sp. JU1783]|nr:unnamed protein product [Auanema sp. JU1783]
MQHMEAPIRNNTTKDFNMDCQAVENLKHIVLQAIHQFMQSPKNCQLNIQINFEPSVENPLVNIPTAQIQTVQDETMQKFIQSLGSEVTAPVMNPLKSQTSKRAIRSRCPKCREEQNLKK